MELVEATLHRRGRLSGEQFDVDCGQPAFQVEGAQELRGQHDRLGKSLPQRFSRGDGGNTESTERLADENVAVEGVDGSYVVFPSE